MKENEWTLGIDTILQSSPIPPGCEEECESMIRALKISTDLTSLRTAWHEQGLTLMQAQNRVTSDQGNWMCDVAAHLALIEPTVSVPFQRPAA